MTLEGTGSKGRAPAIKSNARNRPPSSGTDGGRSMQQPAGQGRVRRAEAADAARSYAALDLGTNNCRLLVARPTRRGFHVVDAFSRIIRLGEGLSATGALSHDAMDRTFEALRVCAAKMARNNVVRSRLVATEACRIANNGEDFVDRVQRDLGLRLEILSREMEAHLAVSGCAPLVDENSEHALVFDIGGGSSELVWLDLAKRRCNWRRSLADRLEATDCIAAWTSLPAGVVTLAEKFGARHVDDRAFENMVAAVENLLAPFETKHRFKERTAGGRTQFLGTSGTVTTVAGIQLNLARYDRSRVDGCWLAIDSVRKVTSDLLAQSYEERVAQPCVGRDRADLVLAGCAILEALLRTWPAHRLRVADRGLREGILTTLMAEDARRHGPHRRSPR